MIGTEKIFAPQQRHKKTKFKKKNESNWWNNCISLLWELTATWVLSCVLFHMYCNRFWFLAYNCCVLYSNGTGDFKCYGRLIFRHFLKEIIRISELKKCWMIFSDWKLVQITKKVRKVHKTLFQCLEFCSRVSFPCTMTRAQEEERPRPGTLKVIRKYRKKLQKAS